MKTKPDVSDEEIRGYMNFEDLLEQHSKINVTRPRVKRVFKISLIVVVVGALSILWYNMRMVPREPEASQSLSPDVQIKSDSLNNETLAIDELSKTKIDSGMKDEVASNKRGKENSQKTALQKESDSTSALRQAESVEPVAPEYVQAEPVEGYENLYDYFSTELKYPEEAIADSLHGVVTVSFIINKEGKPVDIHILKSLGAAFDKESIRLIESMPAWKPATLNGKNVDSKLSLPLTFTIKVIKPKS